MSQTAATIRTYLKELGQEVVNVEHHVLGSVMHIPHLKHEKHPVHNVNDQVNGSFSPAERVALFITQRVGSFGFFMMIVIWSAVWLIWNTVVPRVDRFDPAPAFVMWLFISNLLQIMLMPLIMVGQNLLNRHSEMRSEEDFQINLKAEKENQAILLHLEHQAAQIERQGELIMEILRQLPAGAGKCQTPANPADAAP